MRSFRGSIHRFWLRLKKNLILLRLSLLIGEIVDGEQVAQNR